MFRSLVTVTRLQAEALVFINHTLELISNQQTISININQVLFSLHPQLLREATLLCIPLIPYRSLRTICAMLADNSRNGAK